MNINNDFLMIFCVIQGKGVRSAEVEFQLQHLTTTKINNNYEVTFGDELTSNMEKWILEIPWAASDS